jgi:hypothetical protein
MKIFQKIRTRIAARKLPLDAAFWREVLELGAVVVRAADPEPSGPRFTQKEIAEVKTHIIATVAAASKNKQVSEADANKIIDAFEDIAGEIIPVEEIK